MITPENEVSFSRLIWPGILFVLAFNIWFASQAYIFWTNVSNLQTQTKILAEKIEKSRTDISRSRTIQTSLEGLANDMLLLANNDSDIRRIVDKYQIRKNTPVQQPKSR